MRLIDADKLIEDVLNSMPTGSARGVFRAFIEGQPTAFDVDKVVKQLEELKEWEDVDGKAYYTMSEKQVINKAIKIVKRGGINDN